MTEQQQKILDQWYDGLLTTKERDVALDRIQTRGGSIGPRYTGYDYQNQQWIEYCPV